MSHWQLPTRIDRLDIVRGDEKALDQLAADPRSRLIHLSENLEIPMAGEGLAATSFSEPRTNDDLLLGQVESTVWWARRGCGEGADLRYLDLPEAHIQLAMMATALFEWHDLHPVCLRCGGTTEPAQAGAIRLCRECGAEQFPRTDPAVIVAITDHDDRLLLTHNAAWAPGRVSIQAGFVEAGESAEQACYREITEETGLEIETLEFAYSQPWPFPRSLMMGFRATVNSAGFRVDGHELTWGRFFTRDEFRQAIADGEISLPGPISLARQLIETWVNRG